MIYADIIVDISHEKLDRSFQYRVPKELEAEIQLGMVVTIPFGNGNHERKGYVTGLSDKPAFDISKMKELHGICSSEETTEERLIALAAWMKNRYGSTMVQALKTVLPVREKVKAKEKRYIVLNMDVAAAEQLAAELESGRCKARARLVRALLKEKKLDYTKASRELGMTASVIRPLVDQGAVLVTQDEVYRMPVDGSDIPREQLSMLTETQEAALLQIQEEWKQETPRPVLIHGVTGSGKTQIYMKLIQQTVNEGKQVIVLIPEIALTYQTVRRFYGWFGDKVPVLNSRLSQGERYDQFKRAKRGEIQIMVGPRSALFTPFSRLGLIIIDEEHEQTYKSENSPRYHARETAVYRAGLCGASVVLGSATPSVEAYARALSGEYKLWTLKKRAGKAMLPTTQIIDLREEFKKGNRSIFSGELHKKIEERLAKKEQIMLFLNRRGFAGFVSCRACGQVIKCPHCDVTLTYHRNGKLRCHYCGYEETFIKQCPICKSSHVAAFGLGTEKVEAALHAEFPTARVLRMDMDTTRRKHAHEEMLAAFSKGEADILLGTQMIVKGHDYANVTLVGILAADLSLHEQDFRSGEKTFQLLCQAAGRAGRGDKRGDVIIQTYSPEHYSITTAAEHSYENFFKEEYTYRQLMGYPPCAHMLVILVQSGDESQSVIARLRIEKMIEQSQVGQEVPVQILTPGQASLSKLKDVYRQVLYLKHKDKETLLDLKRRLEPVLEKHPMFAGITIQFDFDPLSHY